MKTKPIKISDEAITKATGQPWAHWLKVLKGIGAERLEHKVIATKLYEDHGVPRWWCQMLTVRFEQEIGRRKPGQIHEGEYSVGASATVEGSVDDVLAKWCEKYNDQTEFNSIEVSGSPRITESKDWRYWKVNLADGSKMLVNFANKADNKSMIQVQLEKLKNEKTTVEWRNYWKEELASFK